MSSPIIDSHIHLYAASHISRLNWTSSLPKGHPLNRQNSVEQYRTATANATSLRGFIFLETDRKSGLTDHEWDDSLDELSFLVRIAQGKPQVGEGHISDDKDLLLGIVPWAPVPAGPEALAKYMSEVRKRAQDHTDMIKGVRYLLQDKAACTMLSPNFIESLKWLGNHGWSFDLGVDARSGGLHQLDEACQMMDRVYAGGSNLRIIINHMCKPNFHLTPEETKTGHPDFANWQTCIMRMASHKNTYMKLSGMFSELPPQNEDQPTRIHDLVHRTKPWVDTIFEYFGPSRIMFGSDWPVCNLNGPGISKSWSHYTALVTTILQTQHLSPDEASQVWYRTAMTAYNISL